MYKDMWKWGSYMKWLKDLERGEDQEDAFKTSDYECQ